MKNDEGDNLKLKKTWILLEIITLFRQMFK